MTDTAGRGDDEARGEAPGLLRSALLLLPLQALFRGGEAVLPLLLAAWFGRTAETDLYYVLAAYFVFAGTLLTGAFQDSAVVPVLIEVERDDKPRYPEVVDALFGHTLAIGAALAALTAVAGACVVLIGGPRRPLAFELIGLMAVQLVVGSMRAFFVGLFNARGHFRVHPVASGAGVALTLGILALGRRAAGVELVPVALIAGELVASAVMATLCRSALGLRVRPSLARPEQVRRILKLVRLETLGQLITRANPLIDQLMAGLAGVVGGGTLLRYANDVASLPTSVLQATLLPVFLTRVAHEAAKPEHFRRTLRQTLAAVVAILAVASLVVAALRAPLCRLLFLHGVMDASGVATIAEVLPWGLVGVAPFGALLILARAHVAQQNSRIMPSMGVLNCTLNAGLNAAFVGRFGLAGIALSTSVTYMVVAVVFWLRLPRALRA